MNAIVKNGLKKLLPLALLRDWQARLNRLRISTIDKLRFPEELFGQEDFVLRRIEYPFRVIDVHTAHLDSRLRRQFDLNREQYTQEEYILIYEQPCVIEPRQGWAISARNKLIYSALGFAREVYVHKPDAKIKTLRHAPLEEYAELVSLRDTGEENYFHFYNDVLVKLFLLEEKLNLDPAIPLLIAKGLFERPYFQHFLAHPYLRDRHWVVQDQQYIRSHKTYFCKPLTHWPAYYPRIVKLARLPALNGTVGGDRRLYITRNPKRLRFVENDAEVASVCKEFDFEVVDFDEMSFLDQTQTIVQARYVVGIHGAGLTNILFRGNQALGLLELYPPSPSGYFPFHYILLAEALGYQYDGLIGQPGKTRFSGGFYVNPAELRQHIMTLLQR